MLGAIEIVAAISRWLTKPKNLMIVGGIVLLALVGIQSARLKSAKHHLKEVRAELKVTKAKLVNPVTKATWESEANVCHAALTAQNAAVAALKADGDRRAQEVARAVQQASHAQRRASDAAKSILNFKPPKTDDTCERLMAVEKAITEASR